MRPRRYTSADEDSARWQDFAFRDGDIIVSTRSKHGTTWMQMILLLLIHQRPELPEPLSQLSPWLDHLVEPFDAVQQRLENQSQRRVIKTHTPLDGIPSDDRATYIVVARHPLDGAVSLYHQGDNIDRDRLAQLTGAPPSNNPSSRPDLHDWLTDWIDRQATAVVALDSLPGVMWHLTDAWVRRDQDNVALVHFDDLQNDLEGQMRRLADLLGLTIFAARWDQLVVAAGFDAMRAHADQLAPNTGGVLKDPRAFFRQGRSGAGASVLDAAELKRYHHRVRTYAPGNLLDWLHRGRHR